MAGMERNEEGRKRKKKATPSPFIHQILVADWLLPTLAYVCHGRSLSRIQREGLHNF